MKLERLTYASVDVRTGAGAAETSRGVEGRSIQRLADDPDRPVHRRGRGRTSYLEPYLKQSMRYIVPAIEDLAEPRRVSRGTVRRFPPGAGSLASSARRRVDDRGLGPRHGRWDALAKAANLPLAVSSAARSARCRPTTATASG